MGADTAQGGERCGVIGEQGEGGPGEEDRPEGQRHAKEGSLRLGIPVRTS
jgi:hypothetical protein